MKEKLANRKQKIQSTSANIQSWQEYAIQICKDFSLQGNYRAMIFKMVKKNKCYVEGKVALCKEKWGNNLAEKGNYFIALFRKNPPWK